MKLRIKKYWNYSTTQNGLIIWNGVIEFLSKNKQVWLSCTAIAFDKEAQELQKLQKGQEFIAELEPYTTKNENKQVAEKQNGQWVKLPNCWETKMNVINIKQFSNNQTSTSIDNFNQNEINTNISDDILWD
jgi:hypothetical protein